MRSSYNDLEKIMISDGVYDLSWNTSISKSLWLDHVAKVLMSSLRVCYQMVRNKRNVLVHCSDGWDRTAQVCSLVQILLDPYFRTIEGFQIIISKEWLKAGHRLQYRTGHGEDNIDDTNRSPVFMQFLDCCWQLLNQYPLDFEFNELLLLDSIDQLYSGRFGTFFFNNERERVEQNLPNETTSYFDYIDDRRDLYLNPKYVNGHQEVIFPSSSSLLRNVTLWEGYWMRYSTTMESFHRLPKDVVGWCKQRKDAIISSRKIRTNVYSTTSKVDMDMVVALQLELLKKEKEINSLKKEIEEKKN